MIKSEISFKKFMQLCYCDWNFMKFDIEDYEIDYLLEKAQEFGYDKIELARKIAEAKYEIENKKTNKPKPKNATYEYYSKVPTPRGNFKAFCIKNNLDINDFVEIDSNKKERGRRFFLYVRKS